MSDNLPESNFKFRRIFSYVAATALTALIAIIIYRIDSGEYLKDIAFWLIVLLWWVNTYYMVAPSAEQVTRIIQAARLRIFGKEPEQ